MNLLPIKEFFSTTPKLAELCSQNGWPDPDSLSIDVVEQIQTGFPDTSELLCAVTFDEVIMEGSGCEAGRIGCWGHYRVKLDQQGNVIEAALESGTGTGKKTSVGKYWR